MNGAVMINLVCVAVNLVVYSKHSKGLNLLCAGFSGFMAYYCWN